MQKSLNIKYMFIFRPHNHKWARQKKDVAQEKETNSPLISGAFFNPQTQSSSCRHRDQTSATIYLCWVFWVQSRSRKVIDTHTERADKQPANMCSSRAKQGHGSAIVSELKAVNWVTNNPSETITSTSKVCVRVFPSECEM